MSTSQPPAPDADGPPELTPANLAFAEEMYARYVEDPRSVDESWQLLFADLARPTRSDPVPREQARRPDPAGAPREAAGDGTREGAGNRTGATQGSLQNGHARPRELAAGPPNGSTELADPLLYGAPAFIPDLTLGRQELEPRTLIERHGTRGALTDSELQERVHHLIAAYWVRGYRFARLDPLGLQAVPESDLRMENFGLRPEDLHKIFPTGNLSGPPTLTLAQIIERLEETYCRSIGVEFRQVEEPLEKEWLRERMEATCNRLTLEVEDQRRILTKLTDAEIFEQFLHTKFVGAKRFSLEGAESLIPLMELIIEGLGGHGVKEIVIGMAHRGRLNVLANVLDRNPRAIFTAFADEDPTAYLGSGDVKYHLGHSSDRLTSSGQLVHLSLAFNPSHLEWVDAVVEGRVRAKQDRLGDHERRKVVPLLIHGEAAFAGQGIVAELLNASGLEGYATGGTIHVIVNNQIGFTTSPQDARSTPYATDVARMLRVPIFHVNGEDPEAVAQVVKLAVDFRMAFHKDVFIDMYCYRRHGHNETDEPAFTQPLMAAAIAKKPSVRQIYVDKLTALGQITRQQADELARERRHALDEALAETRRGGFRERPSAMAGLWAQYRGGADADTPDVSTHVPRERLIELVNRLTTLPEGFQAHPKIRRLLDQRRAIVSNAAAPIDWGTAEALAFASLLTDPSGPSPIRLSGQDSRRGTFSHRHAVLRDVQTGEPYTPLENLGPAPGGAAQAPFWVLDSPLSEASIVGFEFGFSLDYPDGLVLWEAQFGDFANAAQVVIDQFISSAEDKWKRLSGLVMLLPHGFEGQGPEHSSARLERFLQLCAEDNMQVVNLTTPAQYFHLLRRQVLRPLRKPLIVMTPKSLLRHRDCVSVLDEFAGGGFQRVIPDTQADPEHTKWILLASGKIYYELLAAREVAGAEHVAIVRLEQIYPLPEEPLAQALLPYRPGTQLVWVQEEPWNMGAWYYLRARCPRRITQRWPLSCIARAESASPASGSHASHNLEQELLIERAFTIGSDPVG